MFFRRMVFSFNMPVDGFSIRFRRIEALCQTFVLSLVGDVCIFINDLLYYLGHYFHLILQFFPLGFQS